MSIDFEYFCDAFKTADYHEECTNKLLAFVNTMDEKTSCILANILTNINKKYQDKIIQMKNCAWLISNAYNLCEHIKNEEKCDGNCNEGQDPYNEYPSYVGVDEIQEFFSSISKRKVKVIHMVYKPRWCNSEFNHLEWYLC